MPNQTPAQKVAEKSEKEAQERREQVLSGGEASVEDAKREAERQATELQKARPPQSQFALAQVMVETFADPPVYEVMVDTWGHTPTIARGAWLQQDDCPYDLVEAERRGVVRKVTIAELRSKIPHPTLPLTVDNRSVDETLLNALRFHAGVYPAPIAGVLTDPSGLPVTVTGPQGPQEDPALTKSSAEPVKGAPAARPVIETGKGQSAEAAVAEHFKGVEPVPTLPHVQGHNMEHPQSPKG